MTTKDEVTHPNASAFPAGLSGPALRALVLDNICSIAQLTQHSEREIATLHGMGPKGIRVLKQALDAQGRHFRRDSVGSSP